MKTSTGREEQRLHHTQTWPNSCQAACLAMAAAARGDGVAAELEANLHGPAFDGWGHDINNVGRALTGRKELSCLQRDATTLAAFRAELARGHKMMVHVLGPVWVKRLPPTLSGPHGVLCQPSEFARPIHSVLVVGSLAGAFLVLDPFLSRDGQPIEVTDDELRHVLAGFPAVVLAATG